MKKLIFSNPRKFLAVIAVMAFAGFTSCLEEFGMAPPGLTGNFAFVDETRAALLITNKSQTVEVTTISVTSETRSTDNDIRLRGVMGPLIQRAVYIVPSSDLITVEIEYSASGTGRWVSEDGRVTVNLTLAMPRQVEEVLIYRDRSGSVVVRLANSRGSVYADPDPSDTGTPRLTGAAGEGSVPAVIPSDWSDRIATFTVVNTTNTAVIESVEFRLVGGTYYQMRRIPTRNRNTIALSPGTWSVRVSYRAVSDDKLGHTDHMNVVVVPPSHPQAARAHYIYFRNFGGIHGLDPDSSPTDAPAGPVTPPDPGPPGPGPGVINYFPFHFANRTGAADATASPFASPLPNGANVRVFHIHVEEFMADEVRDHNNGVGNRPWPTRVARVDFPQGSLVAPGAIGEFRLGLSGDLNGNTGPFVYSINFRFDGGGHRSLYFMHQNEVSAGFARPTWNELNVPFTFEQHGQGEVMHFNFRWDPRISIPGSRWLFNPSGDTLVPAAAARTQEGAYELTANVGFFSR